MRRPLTTSLLALCAAAALPLSVAGGPTDAAPGAGTAAPRAATGGADGGGRFVALDGAWIRGGDPSPGAAAGAAAGSAATTPPETRAGPAPRPAPAREPEAGAPPARRAPEGWLVAGGHSPVAGTTGRTVRFTVEVADGLQARQSLDGFAATVTAVLSDPDHGWTRDGTVRLQRIDDPAVADVRVLLADAVRVDELCARAGLDTEGTYSCWNGEFAALNADRWFDGVVHVADLGLYRTYLVNHEVGHGLGHGHAGCPEPGATAPVMMQLSVSDEGCLPNAVPHP